MWLNVNVCRIHWPSHAVWLLIDVLADVQSTYQFIVTSDSTFVLIVDDATSSTTLSGAKAVVAAEQSFFAKYGMVSSVLFAMLFAMTC